MNSELRCWKCGQRYRFPSRLVGRTVVCRKCSQRLTVPAPGAELSGHPDSAGRNTRKDIEDISSFELIEPDDQKPISIVMDDADEATPARPASVRGVEFPEPAPPLPTRASLLAEAVARGATPPPAVDGPVKPGIRPSAAHPAKPVAPTPDPVRTPAVKPPQPNVAGEPSLAVLESIEPPADDLYPSPAPAAALPSPARPRTGPTVGQALSQLTANATEGLGEFLQRSPRVVGFLIFLVVWLGAVLLPQTRAPALGFCLTFSSVAFLVCWIAFWFRVLPLQMFIAGIFIGLVAGGAAAVQPVIGLAINLAWTLVCIVYVINNFADVVDRVRWWFFGWGGALVFAVANASISVFLEVPALDRMNRYVAGRSEPSAPEAVTANSPRADAPVAPAPVAGTPAHPGDPEPPFHPVAGGSSGSRARPDATASKPGSPLTDNSNTSAIGTPLPAAGSKLAPTPDAVASKAAPAQATPPSQQQPPAAPVETPTIGAPGAGKTRPPAVAAVDPPPAEVAQPAGVDPVAIRLVRAGARVKLGEAEAIELVDLSPTTDVPGVLQLLLEADDVGQVRLSSSHLTAANVDILKRLKRIGRLDVSGTGITDAGMALIGLLGNIEELNLAQNEISARGLRSLAALTSLKRLYLRNAHLDDTGCQHLAKLSGLKFLDIADNPITSAGALQLKPLKNLTGLVLTHTDVSSIAIDELHQALPRLNVVPP